VKTIVVAYDDAKGADVVVERATELATAFAARIVLTAVAPVDVPEMAGVAFGADYIPPDPDVEAQIRRALEEAVGRVKAEVADRGVECETRVLAASPVDGILATAEDCDADLIVVGHQERGFLERLLEGSVSGSVVQHAHCDVLVVHSDHRKRG
jgi:nucleotide-binding universal stress UspA family protein